MNARARVQPAPTPNTRKRSGEKRRGEKRRGEAHYWQLRGAGGRLREARGGGGVGRELNERTDGQLQAQLTHLLQLCHRERRGGRDRLLLEDGVLQVAHDQVVAPVLQQQLLQVLRRVQVLAGRLAPSALALRTQAVQLIIYIL